MRSKVAALTAVTITLAFLALPPRAQACSCLAIDDIEAAVDGAPAAFVGTLIDQRPGERNAYGGETILTFEVEAWVKGDLGEVIEVHTNSSSGACGLGGRVGSRIGALLYLQGDELRSDLCSQIDPDALLAVASEPPVRVPPPPTPTDPHPTAPPAIGEDLDPDTSAQTTARIALTVLAAVAAAAGVHQAVKRRRAP